MKLSVAIVGGGISGLTAAFYINKIAPYIIDKLYLFEKTGYLGGLIRSTRFPDGLVNEHGPRTIRPTGMAGETTLQFIQELGLADHLLPITEKHPASRNRLILVNDRLIPLPSSFASLFRTKPPFSRPLGLAVLQDFLTERILADDDNMYNFAWRRFGPEIADYAIDPLCRGVVAGDAKEISVKAILKPLFEAEQQHGSIVRGMMSNFFGTLSKGGRSDSYVPELISRARSDHWKMWGLQDGMQMFPDTIVNVLKDTGMRIRVNSPCEKIKFMEDKVQIHSRGKKYTVDHVFAALPARELSALVKEDHPQLAKSLASIEAVSVAMVNLEYPGHLLDHQAFGFLVPSNQKCDILGTVFDSCNFPQLSSRKGPTTRLTAMMGGRWFEPLFGDPSKVDHEKLLSVAKRTMQERLGMPHQVSRHQVLVLKDCLPQYTVGHTHRLQQIRDYLVMNSLPLTVIGASYDGVSVNDCVHYSKDAVKRWAGLMDQARGETPSPTQRRIQLQANVGKSA